MQHFKTMYTYIAMQLICSLQWQWTAGRHACVNAIIRDGVIQISTPQILLSICAFHMHDKVLDQWWLRLLHILYDISTPINWVNDLFNFQLFIPHGYIHAPYMYIFITHFKDCQMTHHTTELFKLQNYVY